MSTYGNFVERTEILVLAVIFALTYRTAYAFVGITTLAHSYHPYKNILLYSLSTVLVLMYRQNFITCI